MKNFKDFINNPTDAVAYGYEAWLIDYWALWASIISFESYRKLFGMWGEFFTDFSLVELPFELCKVLLCTLLLVSLPLTFWILGTISYFTLPKAAVRYRANVKRAMRDL